jgi:glycosyltransferase involved in cell wall biosynthesis
MIPQTRKPGISFVVRARNEEAYLQQCFESLKPLTVPHEIIVILHKCTDRSKEIAEAALDKGQPIQVFETDQNLSRPGYETAITPIHHPTCIPAFYTWCFSKAQYNWIFKWDADFTASPELVDFLNTTLVLDERTAIRYTIPCQLGSEAVINNEEYLFNCLVRFGKFVFWETPVFQTDSIVKKIDAKIHSIPATILKPYWFDTPWFIGKDVALEERYKKIVDICGPEPIGASRAQCPDGEPAFFKLRTHKTFLESLGINLFE